MILMVAADYETIHHRLAWTDFYGRLFRMRKSLQDSILQGRQTSWGEDLTPSYRAALGVLEDIITIPEKVKAQRDKVEQDELGIEGPDYGAS